MLARSVGEEDCNSAHLIPRPPVPPRVEKSSRVAGSLQTLRSIHRASRQRRLPLPTRHAGRHVVAAGERAVRTNRAGHAPGRGSAALVVTGGAGDAGFVICGGFEAGPAGGGARDAEGSGGGGCSFCDDVGGFCGGGDGPGSAVGPRAAAGLADVAAAVEADLELLRGVLRGGGDGLGEVVVNCCCSEGVGYCKGVAIPASIIPGVVEGEGVAGGGGERGREVQKEDNEWEYNEWEEVDVHGMGEGEGGGEGGWAAAGS